MSWISDPELRLSAHESPPDNLFAQLLTSLQSGAEEQGRSRHCAILTTVIPVRCRVSRALTQHMLQTHAD
ncbi:hypothetical protein C3Z06_11445 [Cupriavidus metallidurans]|nr:hypothetical protein C3Z06_11445 [Cupriavidus metallidurans]